MQFKGQGKINICGFEYIKNIADSRRGGGGVRAPKKNPCISAPGPGSLQSPSQSQTFQYMTMAAMTSFLWIIPTDVRLSGQVWWSSRRAYISDALLTSLVYVQFLCTLWADNAARGRGRQTREPSMYTPLTQATLSKDTEEVRRLKDNRVSWRRLRQTGDWRT